MGKIAIVTDDAGWHGTQLRQAFASRSFDSAYVSLTDCRFDLSASVASIQIPGFDALPNGVFVRGVPGGTLEQVILRLDVLHCLAHMGVVVYNDGRAIERTVDKAMTSFLLRRCGVPTPDTWVCESQEHARFLLMREVARGNRLVMKPLFGSQGVGVTLLESAADLPRFEDCNGVYYLQTFIGGRSANQWQDWRVFVIGGRALAGMRRRSGHWITNRARGADCERAHLDQNLIRLAEAAARAVDIDYAGVDLMQDAQGRFLVTEVNSIPAWRGLQDVCDVNIAERLAERFTARMEERFQLQAIP